MNAAQSKRLDAILDDIRDRVEDRGQFGDKLWTWAETREDWLEIAAHAIEAVESIDLHRPPPAAVAMHPPTVDTKPADLFRKALQGSRRWAA